MTVEEGELYKEMCEQGIDFKEKYVVNMFVFKGNLVIATAYDGLWKYNPLSKTVELIHPE